MSAFFGKKWRRPIPPRSQALSPAPLSMSLWRPISPSRKCFYSKVPRPRHHHRESWLHTSYVDPLSLNSPLFCSFFWCAALPASRTWGRGGVPFSNFMYHCANVITSGWMLLCAALFSAKGHRGEREREAADTHTGGGIVFQAALWPVWGSRSFGYVFM